MCTLVVTAVVLQSCSSLPRHYKRSTLQTQGYQHERRQADLSAELSPEEVMEDVDKIMTAVKSEEARVGHALQENELQNLEKKMERLPCPRSSSYGYSYCNCCGWWLKVMISKKDMQGWSARLPMSSIYNHNNNYSSALFRITECLVNCFKP
ncbi:unnamed protein product [Allacma fusca]|uniref:Uncharacterized protein n=1 Tax=Allacma fusca TaxID=39272 RepID=A0A8J2KGS3_9HEXA|nr:unnamed protein product [Allacma fusca]